jgi:hypothetical protein
MEFFATKKKLNKPSANSLKITIYAGASPAWNPNPTELALAII